MAKNWCVNGPLPHPFDAESKTVALSLGFLGRHASHFNHDRSTWNLSTRAERARWYWTCFWSFDFPIGMLGKPDKLTAQRPTTAQRELMHEGRVTSPLEGPRAMPHVPKDDKSNAQHHDLQIWNRYETSITREWYPWKCFTLTACPSIGREKSQMLAGDNLRVTPWNSGMILTQMGSKKFRFWSRLLLQFYGMMT